MINSITLLGSSSGRNAGDAALIAGIMDSIDTACQRKITYEIPTIRPSYILNNYPNRTVPISMMPWSLSLKMLGLPTWRSIMRTDLSLIFDAVLFDRSLFNPLFNYMSTLAFMLPRAKKRGKKSAFFNVTAGPVETAPGRSMLKELAEMMDFISVRDLGSLAVLQDLGVKRDRIVVAADSALIAPPAEDKVAEQILKALGFENEEILAININAYLDTWAGSGKPSMGKERFLKTYAEALNRALKEIGVSALFVSTQHHDVGITRELMARIAAPRKMALLSNVENNHAVVKAVLGRTSLLFGMRLHSIILASSMLTPVIGITYQPKVRHYLNTLDMGDLTLDFENFNPQSLYEHIIDGWEKRTSLKSRLTLTIPLQQKKAYNTAKIVAALSREEDIRSIIAAEFSATKCAA